jgi:putative oxidoreductase
MSKSKTITLWVASGLVAALFLFAGGTKLLMPAQMKASFAQIGYPGWFATFIGVCEVLGGIGVLIPRVAGLAAACLSIIMVGAVYTVVSLHQYSQAVVPAVVFVVLIWILGVRFKARRVPQPQAMSQTN